MVANDGGPAFPLPATAYDGTNYEPAFGMTLLDWFAGMAMHALVAAKYPPSKTGAEAYRLAAIMLEARKAKDQ